jgi:hypothetical protein
VAGVTGVDGDGDSWLARIAPSSEMHCAGSITSKHPRFKKSRSMARFEHITFLLFSYIPNHLPENKGEKPQKRSVNDAA